MSLEHEDDFFLIGLVLGLAVYNGVLLDFPLPMVLYKKLINHEVGLRNLREMQPTVGKSLQQLLQVCFEQHLVLGYLRMSGAGALSL